MAVIQATPILFLQWMDKKLHADKLEAFNIKLLKFNSPNDLSPGPMQAQGK